MTWSLGFAEVLLQLSLM